MSLKFIIPRARFSYCHVWEKGEYEGKQSDKYECTMLFEKAGNEDLLEKIRILMVKALIEHYGSKDKIPAAFKPWVDKATFGSHERTFLRDGDVVDDDNYTGMWTVKGSNKAQPILFTRDKHEATEEDGLIYSGAYADALCSVWVMDNKYGKRICANLEGLRFREHGEPLAGGGSRASSDDFDDLDDVTEDEGEYEDIAL